MDVPNISASLFLSEQNKPRKSGFDRKGVAKGIVEIWLWETQMESREFIGPRSLSCMMYTTMGNLHYQAFCYVLFINTVVYLHMKVVG